MAQQLGAQLPSLSTWVQLPELTLQLLSVAGHLIPHLITSSVSLGTRHTHGTQTFVQAEHLYT